MDQDLNVESTPKVALCVVYVCPEGLEWLLELHLRKIAESRGDITILAVANRCSDRALEILKGTPNLRLIDMPAIGVRETREHSFYLDRMVEIAAREDFTHFATLDMDSFPITTDWVETLSSMTTKTSPLVAVLRAENGDTALPHPSGFLCRMDFYRDARPSFLPGDMESESWKDFLGRHDQNPDTGIGYSYELQKRQMGWTPLLRSNRREEHRIMAGVYGELFFHLGAVSREPNFRSDWNGSALGRLLYARQLKRGFGRVYRMWMSSSRKRNGRTQSAIFQRLRTDPDTYINELAGA